MKYVSFIYCSFKLVWKGNIPGWRMQCLKLLIDSFVFAFSLHKNPAFSPSSYWNELHLEWCIQDLATKSILPSNIPCVKFFSEHAPKEHLYFTEMDIEYNFIFSCCVWKLFRLYIQHFNLHLLRYIKILPQYIAHLELPIYCERISMSRKNMDLLSIVLAD